ncbi:MAG: hypothetical protein NTV51_09720 [Verrucomicrobia bacterium]|nr:hypothetical protein [Verrucomicrobiota bacterium]
MNTLWSLEIGAWSFKLPALLFACVLLATPASAHPLHTSFAEADYNRTAKKLEVSLRVFADDFEAALGELAGQKISYEKTPRAELDPLIRAYLLANFTVKLRDGTLAPQHVIGHELKDAANEFWLYFELALPAGPEGVRLHSTLLRERFSDQLNSVRIRDGQRETTLVFLPKQDEQTIRFP